MRALTYVFLLAVGVMGAVLYVVLFVKEVPEASRTKAIVGS